MHGPRKLIPVAGRIFALRQLENGLERYAFKRSSTNRRLEAYIWRVPITVPVYDRSSLIERSIELMNTLRTEGWKVG